MSTVQDALAIARTLLNDDAGLQWHDQSLMPKIVLAHQEMVAKLALNGIPVLYESTARVTITAGSLNMGVNLPVDLQTPIKMYEWQVNDDPSNAIPMTKKDFIPNLDQVSTLRFWAWLQQQIIFLGATTDRQVQLDYIAKVTPPQAVTDTLFFSLSETYLGPRVAALVMAGQPQSDGFQATADNNLSMLVRNEVKHSQNLPVRRKPFSYSIKRRGRLWL